MSEQTAQQAQSGTAPIREHEWLQKLVGDWLVETEMSPGQDQPKQRLQGRETIRSLGGLWAFGEGKMRMPGGGEMSYFSSLGYDVTYREYRSCWIASVSSHLWTKSGQLNAEGNVLTLTGDGPDMERDGETTSYRDVFEIADDRHFSLTHYSLDSRGEWTEFFQERYTRK